MLSVKAPVVCDTEKPPVQNPPLLVNVIVWFSAKAAPLQNASATANIAVFNFMTTPLKIVRWISDTSTISLELI